MPNVAVGRPAKSIPGVSCHDHFTWDADTTDIEKAFSYDTSLSGFSNAGHSGADFFALGTGRLVRGSSAGSARQRKAPCSPMFRGDDMFLLDRLMGRGE